MDRGPTFKRRPGAKPSMGAELRRIALERLASLDERHRRALEAMPASNLLALYLNWRSRLIPVQPRRVFRSRELGDGARYASRRPDVDLLLAKVAAGSDLSPHLSARVGTGYAATEAGSLTDRALDLLLNEWNVHHLHIGHRLQADKPFVARSRELLFAVFRPGAAYALDVLTHDDFTNDRLVRIAVGNWPDHGLFLPLNGVPAPEIAATANDRKAARAKRGNVPVEIDGRLYVAPNAISAAGVSLHAVREADRIADALATYSASPDLLVARMAARPENVGRHIPGRPSFELVEAPKERGFGFGIQERASGASLWLAKQADIRPLSPFGAAAGSASMCVASAEVATPWQLGGRRWP